MKTAFAVDITSGSANLAVQVETWCKNQSIGLVVVGPEQPLVDGLTDALEAADIRCLAHTHAEFFPYLQLPKCQFCMK